MHGLSYIQEKLNDLFPQNFSGKIHVYKNSFSICARKQISQAHNDLLCSFYEKKRVAANGGIDWVSEGIDEIFVICQGKCFVVKLQHSLSQTAKKCQFWSQFHFQTRKSSPRLSRSKKSTNIGISGHLKIIKLWDLICLVCICSSSEPAGLLGIYEETLWCDFVTHINQNIGSHCGKYSNIWEKYWKYKYKSRACWEFMMRPCDVTHIKMYMYNLYFMSGLCDVTQINLFFGPDAY